MVEEETPDEERHEYEWRVVGASDTPWVQFIEVCEVNYCDAWRRRTPKAANEVGNKMPEGDLELSEAEITTEQEFESVFGQSLGENH